MVARRRGSGTFDFPWDDQLYEKLKAENEEELENFQKEEEEAEEKAGETEVQAARGKRAEFWARVGDKVRLLRRLVKVFAMKADTLASIGESALML